MNTELKQLIEEYCQGLVPTEEQENEIMMKALDMDEDPEAVLAYMEEVKQMKSKAQLQAEAIAKAEAEAKAEQERIEREKQRVEAEARAKAEAEQKRIEREKQRIEAKEKAKAEAEARERIAAKEAEERAKAEAAKAEAAKAQAEAAKAQAEAARARAEAEAERLKAEREEKAAARAKEKAEAKAAEERAKAEREARIAAEKAKEEAEKKAKEAAATARMKRRILLAVGGWGIIAIIYFMYFKMDSFSDSPEQETNQVVSEVMEEESATLEENASAQLPDQKTEIQQEEFEVGDVEDIDPSEYETSAETEVEAPQKNSASSSADAISDDPAADLKINPDVLAEFPGGMEAMMKFIEDHTMYPAMEFNRGEESTVIMNFIIERDGSVSNIKVSTSTNPSEGFHEEAIRTIKSMPKWKPAMKNGKPIRSNVGTSVKFKLPH